MDDPKTELLALLFLVNGYVLNVPNASQSTEELAFDEESADANDTVCGLVDHDNGVIGISRSLDGVKLGQPCIFTGVGDNSEDFEHIEMPALVVGGSERS